MTNFREDRVVQEMLKNAEEKSYEFGSRLSQSLKMNLKNHFTQYRKCDF